RLDSRWSCPGDVLNRVLLHSVADYRHRSSDGNVVGASVVCWKISGPSPLTDRASGGITIRMEIDFDQLETHRPALTGHCYRMLGSAFDADDAVQETMVRAWRGLGRFDGRASLRTWMYRIATNVCLDVLSDRSRRARPMEERPDGTVDEELET